MEWASRGVAIHHAGLEKDDRKTVEQGFREGRLFVVVATSVRDMCWTESLMCRPSP